MDVLVTGATGFVAAHLIPALVRNGHHVLAAGHDPSRLEALAGADPLTWDLRDRALPDLLPSRLDAIVHLAQANVPFPDRATELFEVNTGSTQRLLDYARAAGVRRIVLASTGSVYGGGERPWREDDRTDGVGLYAATKLSAERLCQAYGELVPYTIFRLFAPYGPGQRGRMIPGLINRIRTGQPVTLREGGRPRINPLYITHVVDTFTQSLEANGNQVVNLAGDEMLSIKEMAGTIGQQLGVAPVIQDLAGASGGDTMGDTARLRQLYRLPEALTPFVAGIRAMLDVSPAAR